MEMIESSLDSCTTLSTSNDWKQIKSLLGKVSSEKDSYKSVTAGSFLKSVDELLRCFAEKYSSKDKDVLLEECITSCFRCLRQACALNSDVRDQLTSCPDLLANAKVVLQTKLSLDAESDSENLLKCCIQFIGNSCSVNSDNRKVVWTTFSDKFSALIRHPDTRLCDCTCMLVHTCLKSYQADRQDGGLRLLDDEVTRDIVLSCIQATAERDLEWGLYVLEDMLRNEQFLPLIYDKLESNERLLVLEVMLAALSELTDFTSDGHTDTETDKTPSSSSDLAISAANIHFIADDVKTEFSEILKLESPQYTGQEKSLVIAKQLEVVSICASYCHTYPGIQGDSKLLQCAVSLLRSVTEIGKSGQNVFSKVEKASQTTSISHNHPVFGLKKDLIRLIGNMAYRHKGNQDLTRSLDGLPLLLDQTVIDSHNPFITQWVVLAIRNLLEDNRANREVLSGMSLQGMSGHMAQLREMGVHTELKGGKVVVKPVEDDRSK